MCSFDCINYSPSVKKFLANVQNEICQTVFYATLGEKSLLVNTCRRGIYIANNLVDAKKMEDSLLALGRSVKTVLCGDASPLFNAIKDTALFFDYLDGLFGYLTGEVDFLILLPEALFQVLPSKAVLKSNIKEISINKEYNISKLCSQLVDLGYVRVEQLESKGQFRIAGDVINIFPIGYDNIIRLNFFGDILESIEELSVDFKVLATRNNILLCPATLLFDYDKENVKLQLLKSAKESLLSPDQMLKQQTLLNDVLNEIDSNQKKLQMGFILPCLNYQDNILTVLDEGVVFFDEPKKLLDTITSAEQSFALTFFQNVQSGLLLPLHKNYYFPSEKVFSSKCKSKVAFQDLNSSTTLFKSQSTLSLRNLGERKYVFDYKALEKDILLLLQDGFSIVLCCGTETKILEDFLTSRKISYSNTFCDKSVFVSKSAFPLSASFLDGKVVIIGANDLFKKKIKDIASKDKNKVFYLPKVNDYVVHAVHGVGKCKELKRMQIGDIVRDYFVIEYSGGDLLYVPTEQAGTISAYLGGEEAPKVNKLGGQDFAKIKEKVKASVKKLAIDLLSLYKEREKKVGHSYAKNALAMAEFEEAFSYSETPDQLDAINAIKEDMESPKAMDRLICGDVGFGKTEIAFRACYKAVLDGKQVAFLCPTSILCEQHFKSAFERFSEFGVRVAALNRLRNKSQQDQIIKDIKSGKIDIVFGTHRLLSSDVCYKDLGLLVLDEEQRFGVSDKEKIKNLKKDIDVITLSATPIPRTLHMSLTGIRDISVIATPPQSRLPIQTVVTEFSFELARDVVMRESARGGQTLIVYNRVETIDSFAGKLQTVMPNIRIGVAHGQMHEKLLSQAIDNLYNGKYDVLVATTLIENGIDLPMANSLLVVDSDRLGLAQLYQLRGRIGRSNRLAYAFFTYSESKVLTQDAYKRLSAIMEFTELGSGFKIAMRDLEIRGAGAILGKEQHGHLEKIGYDLYCKLLGEAVEELKGKKQKEVLPVKMDVEISAFIPNSYITSEIARIKAYTEISYIDSSEALQQIKTNFKERYGDIPKEVDNLFKIAYARNLASSQNIKQIIINKNISQIYLYKTEKVLLDRQSEEIAKGRWHCVLKFQTLPIIEFMMNGSVESKIDQIIEFLCACC